MSGPLVACVQMTASGEPAHNLARAAALVAAAAARGAGLVVLPEAFASIDPAAGAAIAEAERGPGGPLRGALAGLAREHGIWLVGGTVPVAGEPGALPRAACILFAPDGTEAARYDKMHLFDVELPDAQASYRESARFAAGEEIVTAPTPFGLLGLAVCYDLRFPEFFRVQFQRGMRLLAIPSAFTRATGEAHWLPLLRARAIENQCWVVAPNQGGRQSATRESHGGSVIVDPWGRVVASAATGEAVLVAPLEAGLREDLQRRMPVAAHQKLRVDDPQLRAAASGGRGCAAPAVPCDQPAGLPSSPSAKR